MDRIPVTIIRHPKERLSKCSLEPLKGRAEIEFIKAKSSLSFDATGFILLSVNASEISEADKAVLC